jgi:hypothetical protein
MFSIMTEDFKNFIISLLTSFLGVLLALYLERKKMPKIDIKLT